MVNRLLLTLLCISLSILGFGQVNGSQESVAVQFVFEWNGSQVDLASPLISKDKMDTVQVNRLRFYISNIRWEQDAAIIENPKDRYHLIDAANPESLTLNLHASADMSSLYFGFGVDSLTNDAGVHGGDLDPSNGMYWAWQTGYIGFKLEGSNNDCKSFTYHLGGFLDGHDASTAIKVPLENKALKSDEAIRDLELVFELSDFLQHAKQIANCQVMRPSVEAVDLAAEFQSSLILRR